MRTAELHRVSKARMPWVAALSTTDWAAVAPEVNDGSFASARCRCRSWDLAGVWASSSHTTNVSPLHVVRHWQLSRI